MSQPARDQYGNKTAREEGVPLWADMLHGVPPRGAPNELVVVAEEPGRHYVSLVCYDDDGAPAAILHATPMEDWTCCDRRQLESLMAMTRTDQQRRGLMRWLYAELDHRGYCVLHPYYLDRTPDGAALATAVARELDPDGVRRLSAIDGDHGHLHPKRARSEGGRSPHPLR